MSSPTINRNPSASSSNFKIEIKSE
jgi:hypothetical protein